MIRLKKWKRWRADYAQKKRQVTDRKSIQNLVEEAQVVRIALNGEDYPYVVPVNYGYEWENDQLTLLFMVLLKEKRCR